MSWLTFIPRGRLATRTSSSYCKFFSRNISRSSTPPGNNQPPNSNVLPRPAGIASMFRLPVVEHATDLDACFVGIPMDSGTSYRPGTRFGPRGIRCESAFIRSYNMGTGADPYSSLRVADLGDIRLNTYNIPKAVEAIREKYSEILSEDCIPLGIGGEHTISYPILQAMKDRHGPVAMIHVDAHDDTEPDMCGEPIAHGTPFFRAVQEGCLDTNNVVQIGLRGSGGGPDDWKFGRDHGFRIVPAEDCWYKSLKPLMAEIREQIGDRPVYLSFDIDGLDPAFAPATGTPEIGGLTVPQGMEIIRGCRGLNIVGCDLVEVSPPYDQTGNTCLLAANLLFEMLCVLPGAKYLAKP
ncbi:hypothetical protein CAPTEDRAFT_183614 [Capitella teleta]|uniref:Agmatinase n=1 Tax=Capitella teleta TaxID=283909 RepID=R7U0U3_CAPTE|nr:hypothetical protein CAPTEDRAFT_183614 [Capitella teleta]|eukprot:ELT99798.1 hypothetical protein CAPTEDRAFT_183614 [Capitella teleta]